MSTSIAPETSGIPAVPVNDVTGDAPTDRIVPQEDGTPANIADASRLFREKLERIATAPETPEAPDAPVTEGQPRNADGTFASPAEASPAVVDADAASSPEGGAEAEPALFVLKGEEQRGESDIELDITGLPPEVVERLERAQKQGMRAAEHKQAMQKVRTMESHLDAVETEMRVDPEGFVLNRLAPATRQKIAETLLLEHWDGLAPMIKQLWQDDAGRLRQLSDRRDGISQRRDTVVSSVNAAREASAVRLAVTDLIPEHVTEAEAQEFFASGISILQQKALSNEPVTAATVAKQLEAHRRRFFGAGDPAPSTTPPARPKLAVKSTPSQQAAATRTVIPAADIARRARARQAALATAPQGAGAAAVQRPGPPANATVEEASKWIRGQATRPA